MDILSVETRTHGRVLVDAPRAGIEPAGLVVVFHGYGQSADETIVHARAIPGIDGWWLAAVEALHHFYTRHDERVVACWMTRQDREHAIADNILYIDRAVDEVAVRAGLASVRPVFFGFSQGAGTAYRAAVRGRHGASGLVVLGGDVAPEIRRAPQAFTWPPLLMATGDDDPFYPPAKLDAEAATLREAGVALDVSHVAGGHEWSPAFLETAGRWLSERRRAR